MLLDHLSKWARLTRKDVGEKKNDAKRARSSRPGAGQQLTRVDSVLSSIDQDLMAKAAFQCKAYARSLMSFERHLASLQERNANSVAAQNTFCGGLSIVGNVQVLRHHVAGAKGNDS